jgi:hypothetical protein
MGRGLHAAGLSRALFLPVKPLLDWRVAAVVLAVVGWVVYAPALDRVFAADQIWYFAEVGDSSLSAGLRHLDYNLSRVYWKGDELLFRPVTFGWLALANWAFSYHHVWWNIATLAIHVAVALAVFRLLIAIRPSPLALPASVLFLVFEASMELVVWNHLGGYLLAWLGLAVGLRALVLMLGDNEAPVRQRDVITFAAAFMCAALAYELMVPVAGVAALVLLWNRRPALSRAQVVLLGTPVLTFVLLYIGHALRAPRLAFIDSGRVEPLSAFALAVDMVWRSAILLGAWTRDLTLTAALHVGGGPTVRLWRSFEPSWSDPVLWLNGIVVTAALTMVGMSMSRQWARRKAPVLWVLAFLGVAYPALIAIGRPEHWTVATTYYAYPFGLLSVVVLYTVVDGNRLVRWRRPVLAGLVWVFAGIHAYGTWNTAWEIQWWNRAPAEFFTRVGAFVDAHKSEPGFSLSIDEHSEEIDPPIALLVGYPDAPEGEMQFRRMSELLFAPYYDGEAPMYILSPTAEHHVRR